MFFFVPTYNWGVRDHFVVRQDFYHSVRNHVTYDLSISISDHDWQSVAKTGESYLPKKDDFC